MSQPYRYEGDELRLFREAHRWKEYVRSQLATHLRGRVLEVGAGLGGSTRVLFHSSVERWVCLEPDGALLEPLQETLAKIHGAERTEVRHGTLATLADTERFDAIVYLDVLEHIAEDRAELARAATHLAPNGALLVLSPAHPWLFTPFDAAIGHHRRYTLASLRALTPEHTVLERAAYLDAAGMLASLGNRLLLRQSMPTEKQIAVWDRVLVPISVRLDRWLGHRVGKSVLAVWRKRASAAP